MSARQLFLANLASRRCDDSDSDGSSVDDESDNTSEDIDEIDDNSLVEQQLKVTPPRNALPELGSAASTNNTKPLFREKSHSSLLRICTNATIESASPTEAESNPTFAVMPQVPSSPLLRRAESFRRKTSDRQNNKVDKPQPNKPTRHVRSFSHDINARRIVHRPTENEIDSRLTKSLSLSSSFTDTNDELSAVTSVMSTASINSAIYTTAPFKSNILQLQSRREHLPPCPATGGSNAKACTSKSFTKRSDLDDSSTVATEAITSFSGSLSLSHSKSFESSTSKSSASKELERLKRFSIGGIKRNNNGYDAKEEIIGGYEVEVNMNRSDISKNSSEGSSAGKSRGRDPDRDLDRINTHVQTIPSNSIKALMKPGRKSLKELKTRRHRGIESVASAHESSSDDFNVSTSCSSSKKRSTSTPPSQRSPLTPMEIKSKCPNSLRTELRRSQSVTRSSNVTPPTSPARRTDFAPSMATISPVRRVASQVKPMSRTPPRSASISSLEHPTNMLAGRTTMPKTPPRTSSSSDIPSAPLSPLMKSSHKYHRNGFVSSGHSEARKRSISPALRSAGIAGSIGGHELSPKRESIFHVLKPSKLASLSISVLNKAVLPIQSLARSYIAKLKIENRRKNVVVMQSLIRRWNCMRYYKSAKTIALAFQGAYRGVVIRDQLDFQHYCASRIQAVFRGYLGSMTFIEVLKSIILIQSLLRMYCQRNKYLAFMNETNLHLAATQIQSTFRRHKSQIEYWMDLSDILVCQSVVRRFMALKLCSKLKSAIIIQATWRRFLASEYYILVLSDVIVCQSVVRRRIAVTNYNDLLFQRDIAAISIQKVHRGFIARMKYLVMVSDVVCIQSLVRRRIAMQELLILRQFQWCVIVCQSVVRRRIAVMKYNDLLVRRDAAAVVIQKVHRGFSARMKYLILVADIMLIQSLVRRRIAMKELFILRQIQWSKEEVAATMIQTTYRGYIATVDYCVKRRVVITLQNAVRRANAKIEFRALRQVNKAATKIRAAYVGFITRMNYLITLDSIIICQCAIRVMLAKRRLNEARFIRLSLEDASVTKLQSIYRGYVARIEYIITVSSIIICQSAIRMALAKTKLFELQKTQWSKEDSAATLIRATYLGFTARMNYILTVADIIIIQKYVRGYNARILVNDMILNQRLERIAAEKLRSTREDAAIKIQKVFRGFVAYEVAITSLANAIYIQANVRKFLAKIELDRRRRMRANHQCAARIQSAWRSHKAQTNYALAIYGIISIQSIHRRNLAIIKHENVQAQRVGAAVTLQSYLRRHLVICRLIRLSEVRAMYGGRSLMNAEHFSCQVIQKWWKHYLNERNIAVQMRISIENKSATAIQTCFRGYRDCLQFVMMSFSIIQIQAVSRAYLAKLRLTRLRQEREEFDHRCYCAATVIQSCFRGYRDFVRFVLIQYFIIKIQSCARSYNARRLLRHQQLKQEEFKKQQLRESNAALIIERFFIKIKAEIDMEISRLAKKKPMQQKARKVLKGTSRASEQSDRKHVVSSNSSVAASAAPSHFHKSLQSYLSGNSGLDSNIMRGQSPGRRRMPSYQSVTSEPYKTSESHQMQSTVSLHAGQRIFNHNPPPIGVHTEEESHLIRPRGKVSIPHQTALYGGYNTDLGHDMRHSHSIRRDMRSASPSREQELPIQSGRHYPMNLNSSGYHQVPPVQPYAPQRHSTSSGTVQHDGSGIWAPSPSYDNRHPTSHLPFSNTNPTQPLAYQAYHDANIQHSQLLSSHPNQMQNQNYATSDRSVMTQLEPQARLSPVPHNHYLVGVPNRSHSTSMLPVQRSYPGHQMPLTQNRSPYTQNTNYSIE